MQARLNRQIDDYLYAKPMHELLDGLDPEYRNDIIRDIGVAPSIEELFDALSTYQQGSTKDLSYNDRKRIINILTIEKINNKASSVEEYDRIKKQLVTAYKQYNKNDHRIGWLHAIVAQKNISPLQQAYVNCRLDLIDVPVGSSASRVYGDPYQIKLFPLLPNFVAGHMFWSLKTRYIQVQDLLTVTKYISAPEALFPGIEYHTHESRQLIE